MGVYVMHMRGTNFFKIGRTNDVGVRATQIEQGSPLEIDVIGWWPHATDAVEGVALKHIARLDCALRGEWALIDQADDLNLLLDFIEEQALLSFLKGGRRRLKEPLPRWRREPRWFDERLATTNRKGRRE